MMKKPAKKKEWVKLVSYAFGLLVLTGASVIATQLIVGYLMLWILGRDQLSEPVWMAIYSAVSYGLALAFIIFVTKKKLPVSRESLGLKGLPTWTDIGLAPVGFIVYLLLAAGLSALFSLFPWFDLNQTQELGFSIFASGMDRIIAFVVLVVIAPIMEELIFRGWLYGKMRKKLGMVASIFLVSLLFGIVHLQWNVGVNVFALSVVMCLLREITGTVYSGIILHMLKNGIAFYLLYVLGIM